MDKSFDSQQHISNLQSSIDKLKHLVNLFPDDSKTKKLLGDWSIKDLLAHFSGWNLLTISDLEKSKNGLDLKDWIWDDKMDDFNNNEVRKRESMSFDEVFSEFTNSCDKLINAYRELTKEEWNMQFGPEKESTPKRSIQIDIDHIGKDHIQDINNALLKINKK